MRRRRFRSFAALAVTALLIAGAAGTTGPAHAFTVGIEDNDAFVYAAPEQRILAFDQAAAFGTSWLKLNLEAHMLYDVGYGAFDAAVNEARARGWTVQLNVTGNPFYIHNRRTLGHYRPSPGRFATLMSAVARHFRGRVRFYSLWNEPNLTGYLDPQRDGPRIFHDLFAAGYRAVKRADPRAKVLIGEMAPGGRSLKFFDRAMRTGKPLRADGFAHHPYQFTRAAPGQPDSRYVGISNIPKVKSLLGGLARDRRLRTPSGQALPIYFTEFGYPRQGAYYGYPYFTEARRADWSVKAFRLARRSGVRLMTWYQLWRKTGRPRAKRWDTGLLGRDGTEYPVYRALVAANRRHPRF